MKVKPEHYERMRAAMHAVLITNPTLAQDYARRGLSDKRLRWDIWRKAGLLQFTTDTLYPYANDEHVDTALRAIMKDGPPPALEPFAVAYITCALWSSTTGDDKGTPLDDEHGPEDIAPETLARMVEDCADFQKNWDVAYLASGWSHEQAGHDFWLTRNGHGAGFWDRGRPDGETLSTAAKAYGSVDLYIGDDGKVYA